jgi:uncharacterized protein YgiM (DUF1202 family)
MFINHLSKIFIIILFSSLLLFSPYLTVKSIQLKICLAQAEFPFKGEVNEDNVNIRCDSTVVSQPICTVKKGGRLDVVLEKYDWYKVRLPKSAPVYIKKTLVECIASKNIESLNPDISSKTFKRCQNAKVLKDRVNIRLNPSEQSAILGVADKDTIVSIVSETQEWYRIEPIENSFGWIHKGFVEKVPSRDKFKEKTKEIIPQESITVEGTIKPYGKLFKRTPTHKLVTLDNMTFLLKADKKSLDKFNYQKAKVSGKIISDSNQKYPTLEVKILEVID